MGAGFLHQGQELATIYTLIFAMVTLPKHLQSHLGYVCWDRLTEQIASPDPFGGIALLQTVGLGTHGL